MNEEEKKINFKKIKEVCLPIASNLQKNDFKNLNESILKLQIILLDKKEKEMIEILFEYLSFPLILILERDFSFRTKSKNEFLNFQIPIKTLEITIETLKILFERIDKIITTKIDFIYQYLITIQNLFVLYLKNEEKEKILFSNEELKIFIINFFNIFILKHAKEDLNLFRNKKTKNLMALFIGILLDVANVEISKELKIESLNCLNNLINLIENPEILFDFFPGISSFLKNFIIGDYKFGKEFISNSIKVFGNITKKVCSDKNEFILKKNSIKSSSITTIESLRNLKIKNEEEEEEEEENEKFKIFKKKLNSIFEIILNPKYFNEFHSESKIELLKISIDFLKSCSETLEKSIPLILEIIFLVVNKKEFDEELKKLSIEGFEIFKKKKNLNLNNLLIERFTFLIRNFTNIITNLNENEKFGNLILILNYIKILSNENQFKNILYNLIDEISFSILISLEIESNIKIIERISISQKYSINQIEKNEIDLKFPKKIYKNLNTKKNEILIFKICENLGKFGDLNFLLDYFIEILLDSKNLKFHSSIIQILSYIIKGKFEQLEEEEEEEKEEENKFEIEIEIEKLINLYLNDIWNIEKGEEEKGEEEERNLILKYQYVQRTSSILESISIFSTCLKDKFEEYLIKILYSILEKLGESYSFINQSSLCCLSIISKNLKYKSIQHLIIQNSDYIIDEICNRMKFLNFYPNTPFVLESIFEFSKNNLNSKNEIFNSLISLIEDLLDNIFNSLDNFHSTKSNQIYLESFFSILSNIIFILSSSSSSSLKNEKERNLIKKILTKSQHFLSISNISLRIKLLKIVKDCLNFYLSFKTMNKSSDEKNKKEFKENEDLNKEEEEYLNQIINEIEDIFGEIFPLIHLIWPSILNSWSIEKLPQIQIHIIDLIELLMKNFDNFMYSRILNEFYPKLLKDLKENIFSFCGKKDFNFFKTTFEYKIKMKEFKFLNEMLKVENFNSKLSIVRDDFNGFEISEILKPYLDENQPIEIQNEILLIFENLIKEDPDSIWYFINLYLEKEYIKENLKTIKFQKKESKFNINQNLKKIEKILIEFDNIFVVE